MTHKFSELYNKMPLDSRANVEQRVAGYKEELERRIVVPLGMLEAFKEARGHQAFGNFDSEYERGLQGALKWLAENPIVPTQDDLREIGMGTHDVRLVRDLIERWQRRMFLAPDPPPDPTESLLFENNRGDIWADEANFRIRCAYRDGLNRRESQSK